MAFGKLGHICVSEGPVRAPDTSSLGRSSVKCLVLGLPGEQASKHPGAPGAARSVPAPEEKLSKVSDIPSVD